MMGDTLLYETQFYDARDINCRHRQVAHASDTTSHIPLLYYTLKKRTSIYFPLFFIYSIFKNSLNIQNPCRCSASILFLKI